MWAWRRARLTSAWRSRSLYGHDTSRQPPGASASCTRTCAAGHPLPGGLAVGAPHASAPPGAAAGRASAGCAAQANAPNTPLPGAPPRSAAAPDSSPAGAAPSTGAAAGPHCTAAMHMPAHCPALLACAGACAGHAAAGQAGGSGAAGGAPPGHCPAALAAAAGAAGAVSRSAVGCASTPGSTRPVPHGPRLASLPAAVGAKVGWSVAGQARATGAAWPPPPSTWPRPVPAGADALAGRSAAGRSAAGQASGRTSSADRHCAGAAGALPDAPAPRTLGPMLGASVSGAASLGHTGAPDPASPGHAGAPTGQAPCGMCAPCPRAHMPASLPPAALVAALPGPRPRAEVLAASGAARASSPRCAALGALWTAAPPRKPWAPSEGAKSCRTFTAQPGVARAPPAQLAGGVARPNAGPRLGPANEAGGAALGAKVLRLHGWASLGLPGAPRSQSPSADALGAGMPCPGRQALACRPSGPGGASEKRLLASAACSTRSQSRPAPQPSSSSHIPALPRRASVLLGACSSPATLPAASISGQTQAPDSQQGFKRASWTVLRMGLLSS